MSDRPNLLDVVTGTSSNFIKSLQLGLAQCDITDLVSDEERDLFKQQV